MSKPIGEVKLGANGKLIDWYSNDQDLFALPVGTKLYLECDVPTAKLTKALCELQEQYFALLHDRGLATVYMVWDNLRDGGWVDTDKDHYDHTKPDDRRILYSKEPA